MEQMRFIRELEEENERLRTALTKLAQVAEKTRSWIVGYEELREVVKWLDAAIKAAQEA